MPGTIAIDTAPDRRSRVARTLPATPAFEWTMLALGTAVAAGAHVDAWAHGHLASTRETFFTPWHALLYASLAATTAFLVVRAAWTGARPWEWPRVLPAGYDVALLGCLLFAVGGVLDLAWHLTFGIEVGIQALISPTHVLLIFSAGLIAVAPLRAAWRRSAARAGLPAIASATLLLTALTFFTQFDHPYTDRWSAGAAPFGNPGLAEQLGMLGVILQAGLLMGVVLVLVRRFTLPFGALTLLMGVNAVFVTLIRHADPVILVGVAGGVAADVLYALLRPSPDRLRQARLFGFLVPLALYAFYFAFLLGGMGVWWPIHLWAGAPVVAGLAGWLVSLAVLPTPVSAGATLPE